MEPRSTSRGLSGRIEAELLDEDNELAESLRPRFEQIRKIEVDVEQSRFILSKSSMKWRRAWPWVMVFLAPLLLFPDAWLSDGVVSADDHLSVHHWPSKMAGKAMFDIPIWRIRRFICSTESPGGTGSERLRNSAVEPRYLRGAPSLANGRVHGWGHLLPGFACSLPRIWLRTWVWPGY